MKNLKSNIIDLLKTDARYSAKKIATMLGAEESEVKTAIEEMEKNGTIVKYTALINHEKTENDMVEALIEVRVTPQKYRGFDAIAEEIYRFSEVESVYLMSGGYDLCVIIRGCSLKEVASFVSEKLSTMDTVVSTATHFILKKYKEDGTIMQSSEHGERLAVQP